jgi:2-polyprenyl-3-methyl-5-hydroxy-6-metoxy-1,4-benzoquinol methylase
MSKVSEYYDNFLEYLKHDHERENPRHIHIKQRINQLVHPGWTVLDFGCGTGITTKHIAQKAESVIGIDISPKLIEFAQGNSYAPNINYVCGDIANSEIDLSQKSFDIIFMNDVFEHLPRVKIDEYIEPLVNSLSEEGVIYVNLPYGVYQDFIGTKHKELQQIIDEDYYIEDICKIFTLHGMTPTLINIYGLDVECQYLEIVFSKTANILKYYKSRFNDK